MKPILTMLLVAYSTCFSYAEMKIADIWHEDGSSKIMWGKLSEAQKAQVLEWERENAEYIVLNVHKKCSELKNIPKYTEFFSMRSFDAKKKFGRNDVCFSSDSLKEAYYTLADYGKWFAIEWEYYEGRGDKGNPYVMVDWLYALIAAGHYREAEIFFPKCVNSLYPWFKEKDVEERIKKGEGIIPELSESMMSEPWERVLKLRGKSDDPMILQKADESEELSKRMYHNFYSNDNSRKMKALEFYRDNKVRFMIEKAHKTWKGTLKAEAAKCLGDFQ